ncbi:MAG: class II D-tagatose-bisphosphate aldolase, non-catalytic subunit [Desulfobacterales bacterium]|nr:class II D-tagatose-bisphosphate aldolase, non-catalytic subunit [Desulfobacterales bacterium]
MDHPLLNLHRRRPDGTPSGVVAVCSSHPAVLRAAIEEAREEGRLLLVEATGSQVNQDGGYTGMTPAVFAGAVRKMADAAGLPADRLFLGADHMGPIVWKHEPAQTAMKKAAKLVRCCIQAGFAKIHLDTSAACADEAGSRLPVDVAAVRAAALCQAAEAAAEDRIGHAPPVYVIGEDVPPPGGGLEEDDPPHGSDRDPERFHQRLPGGRLKVTGPEELAAAIDQFEKAFRAAGLETAWERMAAVVVQPGVEFGNRTVAGYRREQASKLAACHSELPGRMTFEVHSADYQAPGAVAQMIEDHFSILKIGPCLTFAYREALFALAGIEEELPAVSCPSNLRRVMEALMTARPEPWKGYYRGPEDALRYLRSYSLRDRIRYYWMHPEARKAVARLMENLAGPIPDALLHQYLPDLCAAVGKGLRMTPQEVVSRRIQNMLEGYTRAADNDEKPSQQSP